MAGKTRIRMAINVRVLERISVHFVHQFAVTRAPLFYPLNPHYYNNLPLISPVKSPLQDSQKPIKKREIRMQKNTVI